MNKNIKIKYLLSEEGQKKDILSGGSGKMVQEIKVPLTEELLKLAAIDKDGSAIIKVGINEVVDYEFSSRFTDSTFKKRKSIYEVTEKKFDVPQTPEQLLAYKTNLNNYLKEKKESLNKIIINEERQEKKKQLPISLLLAGLGGMTAMCGQVIISSLPITIIGVAIVCYAVVCLLD